MNIPKNLKYTRSHEWVEHLDGGNVRTGLTDFAQQALGNLVFVNLPENGDEVVAGESYADVESVKAVSDVNSPVSGTVFAINEEVIDRPEMLNEDPYVAWMVEISEVGESVELLEADAYEALCREEE